MHWVTSSCLPVLAFLWLHSNQTCSGELFGEQKMASLTSLLLGDPSGNSPSETTSPGDSPLVEISNDLSEGEHTSIRNRRKVVAEWYRQHNITVAPEDVPVIALMGSGGSLTATISFLAMLDALKEQNLLNAALYTYGCSGSTWALATLYSSGNWVDNLEKVTTAFYDRISDVLPDLGLVLQDLLEAEDREDFSLTDVWGAVFVNPAMKQHNRNNMSSWRALLENGSLPYCICAAVDKLILEKTNFTNQEINFEFTSHLCGYPAKRMYVDTAYYGSKFENKQLEKRFPEPDLSYLQALWGSAIASKKEMFPIVLAIIEKIFKDPIGNALVPLFETVLLPRVLPPGTATLLNLAFVTDLNRMLSLVTKSIGGGDSKQPLLDLVNRMAGNEDKSSYKLAAMMAEYWDSMDNTSKTAAATILSMTLAQEYNPFPVLSLPLPKLIILLLKIVKCLVNWEWGTTNNFAYKMTNKEPSKIYLMDSGVGMMTPFPQALRSARNTTLMINFDYWTMDPFRAVSLAAAYCSANNISFPPVVIPEGDELNPSQACYIFEGENTPTVILIPLFNKQNSGGGIKMLTAQYIITRNQFLKPEIDALVGYASKNIRICADKIREKILQLVKKP